MSKKKEILKRIFIEPLGTAATSGFLVCIISGVLLAIPFKINDPENSIRIMLIDNPAAVFIRNIHFWSAQLFLVLTLLHMTDHFYRKTEFDVGRGIWTRLLISVPVIFFVMISGFILRSDPDADSAFRILSSLVDQIPLAGKILRFSILGSEDDLQIVYVHHLATATIILAFIIFEHSGKIWPSVSGFMVTTFVILLISYFIHPSIGIENGKGPWYFLGLQEMLSWSPRPGWIWILLLVILLLMWFLPRVSAAMNRSINKVLLFVAVVYILLTIAGGLFRGEAWQFQWPWNGQFPKGERVSFYLLNLQIPEDHGYTGKVPVVMGRPEGCIVCHFKTSGFSPSHDPLATGCWSCHGGNPATLNKHQAHNNMVSVPGNLADAVESCGTSSCHPDIVERVPRSIMSTMSGVVTVDRFVFHETMNLDELNHIQRIGHSPADQHLRDLCANCHLGNIKSEPGPVNQLTRGGGCNACHLNYNPKSLESLASYKRDKTVMLTDTFYHPDLNLEISANHCFGCHSRSGRIATNYEGWHETMLVASEIIPGQNFRILEDGRVFRQIRPDIHHQSGLQCTDCHISYEVMGDGNIYAHKEDQVRVGCEDCHFEGSPETVQYVELDDESRKIANLRKWNPDSTLFLATSRGHYTLLNAWLDGKGKPVMKLKLKDTLLPLIPPAEVCLRNKSHQSLTCEACHTSWVPQCLGCHNAFDPGAPGFDMLKGKDKKGTWTEYIGKFMAEAPTLGVVTSPDGTRHIRTFTPGMILTIDTASFDQGTGSRELIFHRLFAPAFAHTIVREARGCRSCHLDPLAVGYGRGQLVYHISTGAGQFEFINQFENSRYDLLPEDAWIGFLSEPKGVLSTRSNTRPFNLAEQQSILTVGACLGCHTEDSGVMRESLNDFEAILKKTSDKCILPYWIIRDR